MLPLPKNEYSKDEWSGKQMCPPPQEEMNSVVLDSKRKAQQIKKLSLPAINKAFTYRFSPWEWDAGKQLSCGSYPCQGSARTTVW